MERLLLAFVLIGTTLVRSICYLLYDKAMDIASHPLNFSNLNLTDVDGHFAYTFTLFNANCTNVKAWLKLIPIHDKDDINGTVTCVPAGTSTSANANLIEITAPPPPTTTTATPLVILPGGALPAAPVITPYQSDYEEIAEHVEETVSSFESMSITSL
uniref:Uncharacterized protein n=1 Tax=Haemonchus contortus TaxID=6289 RepID=W6NB10_HAECO